jgi:hypothetical protein
MVVVRGGNGESSGDVMNVVIPTMVKADMYD